MKRNMAYSYLTIGLLFIAVIVFSRALSRHSLVNTL
jgi:hypothetical protein